MGMKTSEREELRSKQLREDPKFAGDVAEKAREREITATAQKGLDIEAEKKRLQIGEPTELGEPLLPEDRGEPISTGEELAPGSQINKDAVEMQDIQNKLAQPETGKILDSINRWRLEVKLDNLQNRTTLGGTLPIGIPASAITAVGGSAWKGVGQLTGRPTQGGLIGSTVTNAKTVALTGSWLKKAGFTIKAASALGALIGLVAWGKHVKSEAIEFLPYQIAEAKKYGDEASAKELEQLFYEIRDPTGWANIIEEIPGLGVIKAALDKMEAGAATIEAISKRPVEIK